MIQYHWFSARKYETNELEVYWPLALLIAIITVLHICQTTIVYRGISKDNQSISKSSANAKLQLLAKKLDIKKVKDQYNNIFIAHRNSLEPKLYHKSIATTLNLPQYKTFCEYFQSICSCCDFICYLIVILIVGVMHTVIPTISRYGNGVDMFVNIPWQVKLIRVSYIQCLQKLSIQQSSLACLNSYERTNDDREKRSSLTCF